MDRDDFRALFDAAPLPMFVAERGSLQIFAVNRAACDHYGYTRDEFLALTLRDIRPPEELTQFEQSYEATKPAGSYSRSARHRTKSGKIIDVTLEIAHVTVEGRPASIAIVTDVTGIAQADRRFRLLVEHSSEGIAVTDTNNIVEYVSPGGLEILGTRAEDVIGRSPAGRTHPDDVPRWTAPKPGETRYHVARLAHRDGSWRWIESSTTNLTHEPAVRAFVSNYRDITARKLAELSVARSELSFRTLIERSPAATLVHRAGRCVYVNPAAVAMLGYREAAEVMGRPIADLIDGETATRMTRADGSTIAIEAAQMLLDFDGEPSTVVMAHDVTARHQMFAQMALADRMITVGTLAAGVAHEINNPLAYVAANLETLAAELPALEVTPRSRLTERSLTALVADAREGVARMSAVVRDLRSLSRLDDETRGPVDVVAVLRSSLKMAHNEIRHRAQVVADFADDLPRIAADASRLGQVFLNLLVNAAQAIPEGRASHHTIALRVAVTADGQHVRIDVRDSGVGITPEVMPRIFDPFFTTKRPGVGTGLGLAISHQIVRAMDGELRAESSPGLGSTFSVILPVERTRRGTQPPEQAAPAAVSGRVLLVDDEVALGRSLALLLAPETIVIAVTSAKDALARIERGERYDAILCDLMMPEISGMELYKQLAEQAPEYTRRIVFMTGGAFTAQARDFLAKLDRPHLDKPFSEAQLRDALAAVIS